MAKLRIDIGTLLMAFASSDGSIQWFLDRQTGEVIGLDDNLEIGSLGEGDEEDAEDAGDWQAQERALRRRIYGDVNQERYLAIPSASSREGFEMMEDFARSQDDARVLLDVLARRKPFRSFKHTLARSPELSDRWYAYQEQRLLEQAFDWLRSEGIDVDLPSPAPDRP